MFDIQMTTSTPFRKLKIEMSESLHVDPTYRAALERAGLRTIRDFFLHKGIKIFRDVHDRQNGTLDLDGFRIYLKRDTKKVSEPMSLEAEGIELLKQANISTLEIVAHGSLDDGRTFIATRELLDYRPADMLLRDNEIDFDSILIPTSELSAKLHNANLHHRDLYLNHFFVNKTDPTDLKLIDAARVRRIPRFFRHRWIVKDLAQFFYSTRRFKIDAKKLRTWLERYVELTRIDSVDRLQRSIETKADWIARHDQSLNRREPNRNVPIPEDRR